MTADREAAIELAIAGPNLKWLNVEAVIDTGFNGYLTLPDYLVDHLQLPFAGHRQAKLLMRFLCEPGRPRPRQKGLWTLLRGRGRPGSH